jgi:transcriptional regulator GlxA family with amidase domain
LKLSDGDYVRVPTPTLMGLLKSIGQSKDSARPLYQALGILHALETQEIPVEADKGFEEFIHKIHHFRDCRHLNCQKISKASCVSIRKKAATGDVLAGIWTGWHSR